MKRVYHDSVIKETNLESEYEDNERTDCNQCNADSVLVYKHKGPRSHIRKATVKGVIAKGASVKRGSVKRAIAQREPIFNKCSHRWAFLSQVY